MEGLGAGEGGKAVASARQAAELDQTGFYADLVDAVETAAGDLTAGDISATSWELVAAAVGPGPLAALVERVRSAGD